MDTPGAYAVESTYASASLLASSALDLDRSPPIALVLHAPPNFATPSIRARCRRRPSPAAVLQFFRQVRRAATGTTSPRTRVTLPMAKRAKAGVPPSAASFSFVYPLPAARDLMEALLQHEAISTSIGHFLLLGGFCYFDQQGQLLAVNAISADVHSPARLLLDGPHRAHADALRGLRAHGRLQQVTLSPLVDAGFHEFCWVNPSERLSPGGVELADGISYPDGAFLYQFNSGPVDEAVFYRLYVYGTPEERFHQAARVLMLARHMSEELRKRLRAEGRLFECAVQSVLHGVRMLKRTVSEDRVFHEQVRCLGWTEPIEPQRSYQEPRRGPTSPDEPPNDPQSIPATPNESIFLCA